MTNPQSITPDLGKLKLGATTCLPIPDTYWITITNVDDWNYIVIPTSGALWICYEWSGSPTPPAQVLLWQAGSGTTPINPGGNNFQVIGGDVIMYQLTNPGSDTIKLAYQVT